MLMIDEDRKDSTRRKTMVVVGADGCRGGWLAVLWNDDDWDVQLFPTIDDLWQSCLGAGLILLDIPIGLPDGDAPQRACDVEARRRLSPHHHSSVFPPPSRAALEAASYEEASAINRSVMGKGLTRQSWGIAPKIREVDRLLRRNPRARAIMRESHPELCFWALNGCSSLPASKRTGDGQSTREQVLAALIPETRVILRVAQSRYGRLGAGTDDILDALALAVTARLGRGSLTAVPGEPIRDAHWLPMEMVYWSPQPEPAAAGA
ncbi:DUF429 domain-containing protein [Aggregatilinea sp.]|uniref:DUF429 domain-containing protein n=1 Tax=Aggregatilinea sp. TaxID=2806333 RepID=UPI002D1FAFE8|nr:DUF429 domain-containing protein [Aggregatilinea sp.]